MAAIHPTCGMSVEEREAAATLEHGGTTYLFCGVGGKEEFEENLEDYAEA